jgi:DNA polymerase V
MKLFGLADCNNFYCSCERVFHPDLRDKPVVILSNNDGCVIARSEESKALGIKMGEPFFQVKEMLEKNNVAVFSSNYTLYGDMSKRVMSLLSKFVPEVDVYSIDEAFLEFADSKDIERLAEECRRMVAYIHKGTGIPVSLGIAPTKTLAKMASKFAKKHKAYKGVCIIETEEKRTKALKLFPAEDVWGIGHRHAKKLAYHGINTAWDFTQRTESWIRREMTVTGVRTWKELRGESCISTEELPHKKSICTSRSFSGIGLNGIADVEEAVANFAAACSHKLRQANIVCSSMTIFAYTSRFCTELPNNSIHVTTCMPVPTNSMQEMVDTAVKSLRNEWREGDFFYKKAGVIVWDISPDNAIQGNLFDTIDRKKQEALAKAIDEINHKNGYGTIRTAVQDYRKNWHLKNEYLSRQYTTNIDDVIKVKVTE